eukprot:TRINITY_DN92106_c0_g1_i1.p1 TRINITY_DN92106_c0_g1~~TRINITY_DN92106_c0_g1_i1.p1  ORF type:complete len:373 (-),score=100.27 TRINITY_DN92106_c0_g1_i1:175-1293(-)
MCRRARRRAMPCTLVAAWVQLGLLADAAREQKFELHIPRVTTEMLEKNATLRTGLHPYVLIGHMEHKQWKAMNWTLDYLHKKIPFEWVDYYEKSLKDENAKPYLFKYQDALPRFKKETGHPRYMQLRLSLRGWQRLRKDLEPLPVRDIFWSDEEWIAKCMQKDGKPDKVAIDNFYTTVQWKFLLIGEKGTTMFLHKDGTASSSWQAQVTGRKKWTLCPNSDSRFLDTRIDTFSEEAKKHSSFAKATCGQVVVSPGEMIYYPGYWWHHTLQLETPSIAYTGALVGTEAERSDIGHDRRAHASFLQDMREKCGKCWQKGKRDRLCDDISLKWPGAAPPFLRIVCDEYLPKCFELWDKHARALNTAATRGAGHEL